MMKSGFFLLLIALAGAALPACVTMPAEPAEPAGAELPRVGSIPDIGGVHNEDVIRTRGRPSVYVDCEIIEGFEDCRTSGYAHNSVFVPSETAPFQVEIITTEQFATSSHLTQSFPDRAMWEMRHACGGALIDPNWVLTAAHCFGGSYDADLYAIRAGLDTLSTPGATTLKIEEIIPHPDFSQSTLENDIALIRLTPSPDNRRITALAQSPGFDDTSNDIEEAVFLPGGQYFWTEGFDNRAVFWAAQTGEKLYEMQHTSRDHIQILSGNAVLHITPAGIRRLDLDPLRLSPALQDGSQITNIALSEDAAHLLSWGQIETAPIAAAAAGAAEARLTLWDMQTFQSGPQIDISDVVTRAEFLSPGVVLIEGYSGRYIWHVETGDLVSPGRIGPAEYLPVRQQLVSADSLSLLLTDANSGALISELRTPDRFVPRFQNIARLVETWIIGVSADERYVLSRNGGSYVLVWDLETGALARELALSANQQIAYDPAAHRLLAWETGRPAEYWDVATGQRLSTLPAHDDVTARNPEFFSGGEKVLQWNYEGISRVYDSQSGEELNVINHSLPIVSARLSADEQRLLTRGDYGLAEVWDIKAGAPLLRAYHGRALRGSALSDAGDRFLTWGGDGIIRIWSTETGQLVSAIRHDGAPMPDPTARVPNPVYYAPISRKASDVAAETFVNTFGWGKTRPTRHFEPTSVLQWIGMDIVSKEKCLELGGWEARHVDANVFCAYAKDRKTCFGDSGGPVMSGLHEQAVVVGVVSWGSGYCGDDNKPSVYTRVHIFADWIRDKVCADTSSDNPGLCGFTAPVG